MGLIVLLALVALPLVALVFGLLVLVSNVFKRHLRKDKTG